MNFKSIVKNVLFRSQFVASNYRDWRDKRAWNRPPSQTSLGFLFNGNRLMESGKFEPVETELIKQLLKKVDVVINVGANIGYYCCIALANGKKVVAFEPMPTNLHYLCRNVYANGWSSMFECYPVALSNNKGLVSIYGSGTGASLIKGWSGQNYSTIVPAFTLDSLLNDVYLSKRLLVIIDVEGAEYAMLQGAAKLLASKVPPIWFVEISVTQHQPKGVTINPSLLKTFDFFYDNGYSAITADHKKRLVTRDELLDVERTSTDTLNTHNFIFFKGLDLLSELQPLNGSASGSSCSEA